ncbi:MAG: CDP-diacylglycerol O-phosphatidyltransferase [Deltaproteobacteria bacterium]|nr:CDP-diacylglycerol O-phosphatidyltransferase [Deltaproteobacteria bacterium]
MSLSIILAWLVHLYTASGTVVAFFALFFIDQAKFQEVFWLMSLAVLIDASDGTLARMARVKEVIPWFDGDRLEDIVDYLNYVLVPCLFLIRADLLPKEDALWLAAIPLLASAYGFCQKEAKTSDHFFLGFPSYWNIVAFYLYVLQIPQWINAFLILILSILVFVPIKYLYPSRSPILRGLTISLGVLWGILVLTIIYLLPQPPSLLVPASLLFPAYYMIISLWLAIRELDIRRDAR